MAGLGRLNPIGALLTAATIAAAVGTRLISGRSFEGIGQEVNNILLGDMDDEARASAAARQFLMSDPQIARTIGREGQVNSQIERIYRDLKRIRLREERGRTAFLSDPEFDVNGKLDMLILRGHDVIVTSFKQSGGMEAIERLRTKMERPKAGAR